uniref:EXPERA domain-containing protein n=1 Tax=Panagrolaimus sp. ES5 TaxID=591445 RepID=A0AC34F4V5_9BILA
MGTVVNLIKRWDRPQRGCQLPLWVEIWLGISAMLCTLDVIYTMLRPLTNRGGPLECVYELWNWYADVDLRYATANDLVTMATGRVMIIEIVMNLVSMFMNRSGSKHTLITAFTTNAFVFWKTVVYMALYISPADVSMFMNRSGSKHTLITAFTTNAFVFWKTVVYMALYISPADGNPSYINPTATTFDIIVYFWIPDAVWLLMPFIVLVRLWTELLVYPPGTLPEHPTPLTGRSAYYYTKASNIDDDMSNSGINAA